MTPQLRLVHPHNDSPRRPPFPGDRARRWTGRADLLRVAEELVVALAAHGIELPDLSLGPEPDTASGRGPLVDLGCVSPDAAQALTAVLMRAVETVGRPAS